MASELTDPHVLLLAVQLTSDCDLKGLLSLQHQHKDILPIPLVYRILLSYYPVNESRLSDLAVFLLSLHEHTKEDWRQDELRIDSSISTLSGNDALRRCRTLRLQPSPIHSVFESDSELANFIVAWSQHLEAIAGAQPLLAFVQHFIEYDTTLRSWYSNCLLPVVRLQYEFYPDATDVVGLQDFETVSGTGGVKTLLQFAQREQQPALIARDLDDVVTPWVRGAGEWKRRRIDQERVTNDENLWDNVNEWFLSTSVDDFVVTSNAFLAWDGPEGRQSIPRFAQTGLAIIYACPALTRNAISAGKSVLEKIANLVNELPPETTTTEPEIGLDLIVSHVPKESDLLFNSLLKPGNTLTRVTKSSLELSLGLLATANILVDLGLSLSMKDLVQLCVFGSERPQKDKLRQILQSIANGTTSQDVWESTRRRLLWSRRWTHQSQNSSGGTEIGLLSKIPLEELETQILNTILDSRQFDAVIQIYIDGSALPLSRAKVETHIAAAILRAYDNAGDGNRERGGLRPAYDMLRAFRSKLPESSKLQDIEYLIKATHRLSFYRLNLSHGVAFKPVAIRVQKNPLSLVAKVLEQDPKAYTKLDDLLEIGRSLVHAHLPNRETIETASEPLELRLIQAEHDVTRLAIEAALLANDFDTAYAYITTRLSSTPSPGFTDDTSWRAAYAAGKYRPATTPKNLESRIENLSQRMELLSRALTLAPVGDSLAEILGTWRRHEEEMAALREEGVREERASDAKADAGIPGAFGLDDRELDAAESQLAMAKRAWPGSTPGLSYEEHAPVGLFDVARGAASALRKSSFFPLGSSGLQDLKIRESATAREQDDSTIPGKAPTSPTGGRLRKRDQVTNLVTNGFVSGMGWVLGAQPQDRNNVKGNNEQGG